MGKYIYPRQYIFVNQDNSEQDPSAAGDLHRISINDVLLQKYSEMQEEFEYNLHYGSNFRRTLEPYSSMALQQAVAFRRSTMNTWRGERRSIRGLGSLDVSGGAFAQKNP